MARTHNRLTEEQVAILRSNPYVVRADENTVFFTAKFKERFWFMYIKENKKPGEILREIGIDPHLLGSSRVRGMALSIRNEYARYGRVNDANRAITRASREKLTTDEEIGRLRLDIEYIKREVEFLENYLNSERMKKLSKTKQGAV